MTAPFDERRENFLSRWSRRKRSEPERRDAEDRRVGEELAVERGVPATPAEPAPVKAPPDLPAIESLTPESDFSRFMRPDVPLASRSAAMKKLFTDPHFNVMDGLDTYIEDYTRPDPIPAAMLRELAQSRMLRLFDEPEEGKAEEASPVSAAAGPQVPAVDPAVSALEVGQGQHELPNGEATVSAHAGPVAESIPSTHDRSPNPG